MVRRARVVVVILAAGESRRMGLPKVDLAAGPRHTFLSLLERTIETAGFIPLAVVQTKRDGAVLNRRWREGQMSSVRCGLRAALKRNVTRILVQPIDAPRVTAATFKAIAKTSGAAVARHRRQTGHPVALDAAQARAILRGRAATLEDALTEFAVTPVDVDDAAVLENLNTPAAYQQAFGHPPTVR